MSLKERKSRSVVDSDEENEPGACGGNGYPLPVSASDVLTGSLLEESVDNLSMEVHLGDDNSRHPSEISSVSYQNLLEDGEPSNSIRSRRGSEDSLDSYPPEFPDPELPPDEMETFEASDLPLSQRFPIGSLQGAEKSRRDRTEYSADVLPNPRPNVKLKETEGQVKMREKSSLNHANSMGDEEASSKKRNSLEIRNNIPVVGEVKDYDKEHTIDFNKVQGAKPKIMAIKQSPGLARRVDMENEQTSDKNVVNSKIEPADSCDSSLPSSTPSHGQMPKSKSQGIKSSEGAIEVITPIPKNMNIENEYDYVKYARVQQGNSYVGMRLAYSSSNDSLNIKNAGGSINSSREPSPEKSLQQKINTDLGQSKVSEETLTEIPLNNSDYSEDKKPFTLSPENTECDSVEVESVTSEGENSTPGFPTVEDGLSSSQASDAEETGLNLASDKSPTKMLHNKQKAAIDKELTQDEEYTGPKDMDAQAIMDDLKMKREALDMAIADIKSAIQRSKTISLEASYNTEPEVEESQPVWVKRDPPNQIQRVQDEMRKVREEIERQQEEHVHSSSKPMPEKGNKAISADVEVVIGKNSGVENIQHCTPGTKSQTKDSNKSPVSVVHTMSEDGSVCDATSVDNSLYGECVSQHMDDINAEELDVETEKSEDEEVNANSKLNAVNSAIMAVSNEIIMTLGNSPVKPSLVIGALELETKEKPPSPLPPEPKFCVEQKVDVSEFDTLSPTALHSQAAEEAIPLYETTAVEILLKEENISSDDDNKSSILISINDKESEMEEVLQSEIVQEAQNASETCDETLNMTEKRSDDVEDMNHQEEEDEDSNEEVRQDGQPIGYDSDDECEDAEGIRYTRRNKGKKYAPLQKDDSLEIGNYGNRRKETPHANGHTLSHANNNGSVCNHLNSSRYDEQHPQQAGPPLSSEESSDLEANLSSYTRPPHADSDTDEETDRLLQKQYQERDKHVEIPELNDPAKSESAEERDRRQSKAKEAAIRDPDRPEVLIEGVLFRARYLGSTQLISEGQPSKAMRMMQAQEAVGRIKQNQGNSNLDDKAPEGENQPSTDVDLFVSTEKIMVLNTDLQEIMMDHSLRTISYIADIGDILVIMARRRLITSPDDLLGRRRRQAKILCHVFESDEAQLIAQSIGQAFQVAYLEFLKANGIEDPGLLKEMDYQDVLNQQEIYGEELNLFANKDFHKEVIVPKGKNEPLGVVIVESGWGSMVPTVVLANMLPTGPAARCGQLNIGDQIISINGLSLVGLPLSACQTYIKASKSQTVVKLTVVPCPPVVEVLIKRPDVKYQLGFSVQNGVICSLLRGGIAERGGVRVGHRIIEINNQSVVAVPHEKIVTLLASSVGEIHMKTMPTSIFRLLTGQDAPHYN